MTDWRFTCNISNLLTSWHWVIDWDMDVLQWSILPLGHSLDCCRQTSGILSNACVCMMISDDDFSNQTNHCRPCENHRVMRRPILPHLAPSYRLRQQFECWLCPLIWCGKYFATKSWTNDSSIRNLDRDYCQPIRGQYWVLVTNQRQGISCEHYRGERRVTPTARREEEDLHSGVDVVHGDMDLHLAPGITVRQSRSK